MARVEFNSLMLKIVTKNEEIHFIWKLTVFDIFRQRSIYWNRAVYEKKLQALGIPATPWNADDFL